MPGGPHLLALDLILVNGAIHTAADANPGATAVAIRNGRFLAVGVTEIRDLTGPAARVEDLARATINPGLIDVHNHLQAISRDLGNETEASHPRRHYAPTTSAARTSPVARTGGARLPSASSPIWLCWIVIRCPRLPTSSNTCAR